MHLRRAGNDGRDRFAARRGIDKWSETGIRDSGFGTRWFYGRDRIPNPEARVPDAAHPVHGARRSAPLGTAAREQIDQRLRQHFGEAAASRLQAALLQYAAEIEPIARACERNVEQPLRLLL